MRFRRPLFALMRVLFLVQVILGLGFWTGHWFGFVNLHMLIGSLFVLALWSIAGITLAGRQAPRLALAAILWGVVIAGFGMAQRGLVPGDYHWTIRVLHLAIAMGAMPFAGTLAAREASR